MTSFISVAARFTTSLAARDDISKGRLAGPHGDIRNAASIAGVMADGRWFTPAELETLSRPD